MGGIIERYSARILMLGYICGVGLVALAAIARGESGDAAILTPNYLRLSQAERERLEKEKHN